MFTIRGAISPMLFVLTGIETIDGEIYVYGSACGGVFTCEILLADMQEVA